MPSPWRQLAAETGLRLPLPGSVRWTFGAMLATGIALGWLLGEASVHVRPVSVPLLLSLLLWQPLVEELLFRGVLQGALSRTATGSRRLAGISMANAVTSLLFVLVHLFKHPLPWAVAVFVPSLLFGYYRERAGSVLPPILMHVMFNGAFFAPLYLSPG